MSARRGKRVRSQPLKTQIMRAELRLCARRRRTSASATKLEQSVRSQLTSPTALLLAGGLGFVAGDVAHCNASAMNRAADPRVPVSHFFTRAVGVIAVVRSLITSVQAIQRVLAQRDGSDRKQER
jgi:hypothetical protein